VGWRLKAGIGGPRRRNRGPTACNTASGKALQPMIPALARSIELISVTIELEARFAAGHDGQQNDCISP
jgi:hypothetical protein